ncbi:beta-ketoacyl-[acyl-carrier-protein] synthase family protein [Virgibacillus senegalensis]|uniref:beta-ketoacyl-[acyl-carrier-protein] synthase family protein n=1 Tax=Virgibacillus senegalensis TaxID=1499679 RepID=UPI00069D5966|nr:beta-ketoacyl-[acyl-carrier-protein] synthase family protein [Virgibacillus senegalensis]
MSEIIVSGMGVINAIGYNVDSFWESLQANRNGLIKLEELPDPISNLKVRAGAIPSDHIHTTSQSSTYEKATQILFHSIMESLEDAGLSGKDLSTKKVGICIGTTMGEITPLENQIKYGKSVHKGGPGILLRNIRELLHIDGPSWVLTNACAAGNIAIAKGIDELKLHRADLMIVCGVDVLSSVAFWGFNSLKAMSSDYCKPFDGKRNGMILGEGSGAIILEKKEAHKARSHIPPKAQLLGYGISSDGYHVTQPDPKALGASRVMELSLNMGSIHKEKIDYICAHGTGTPANDAMESVAINKVFAERTNQIEVSSIKGNIGHTLGAASVIEAISTIKTIQTGEIPINFQTSEPGEDIQLNLVIKKNKKKAVNYALSNAYAFGGVNSSLLIGR